MKKHVWMEQAPERISSSLEALTIPATVLAFLASVGCRPAVPAYMVDDGPSLGYYCQIGADTPLCPVMPAVYIRRDAMGRDYVLVHELYHSCQPVSLAPNVAEGQANAITQMWIRRMQ